MFRTIFRRSVFLASVFLLRTSALASHAPPPPLKVFILSGQSNMQGHGYVLNATKNATLEWLVANDESEYGKLKSPDDGEWVAREDVLITYNRQSIGDMAPVVNQHGFLLPGYGGDPGQTGQMGPEMGFGWTVADALVHGGDVGSTSVSSSRAGEVAPETLLRGRYQQQHLHQQKILLLKVAWGGRSLAVDFRPPSSGGEVGPYYTALVDDVHATLSNLSSLFPSYSGSYELAGFAWHQGWNDGCDLNMTAEYEANLANFIRDVREDLGVPSLPFSIGVSGMSGYSPGRRDDIVDAQFAVANATKYPEFSGTVAAVETRDFVRELPPHSPGNQGYHWMNNCESYWLVGQAMGQAMVRLLRAKEVGAHVDLQEKPFENTEPLTNVFH